MRDIRRDDPDCHQRMTRNKSPMAFVTTDTDRNQHAFTSYLEHILSSLVIATKMQDHPTSDATTSAVSTPIFSSPLIYSSSFQFFFSTVPVRYESAADRTNNSKSNWPVVNDSQNFHLDFLPPAPPTLRYSMILRLSGLIPHPQYLPEPSSFFHCPGRASPAPTEFVYDVSYIQHSPEERVDTLESLHSRNQGVRLFLRADAQLEQGARSVRPRAVSYRRRLAHAQPVSHQK
jgi:hypothetical protein